jgi:hypothetical protein
MYGMAQQEAWRNFAWRRCCEPIAKEGPVFGGI